MRFDAGETQQRRYDGYGRNPLPSPLDEEVAAFVEALWSGGPPAVARATSLTSDAGRRVLRTYAERMASLAVRTGDVAFVRRALVAIVAGGLDRNDREALMVMPAIEDSAERVGGRAPRVFEEVARIVGHPGEANLALWLGRRPEMRALSAMGYAVGMDSGGFRYTREW